jgi:hypothetical protein
MNIYFMNADGDILEGVVKTTHKNGNVVLEDGLKIKKGEFYNTVEECQAANTPTKEEVQEELRKRGIKSSMPDRVKEEIEEVEGKKEEVEVKDIMDFLSSHAKVGTKGSFIPLNFKFEGKDTSAYMNLSGPKDILEQGNGVTAIRTDVKVDGIRYGGYVKFGKSNKPFAVFPFTDEEDDEATKQLKDTLFKTILEAAKEEFANVGSEKNKVQQIPVSSVANSSMDLSFRERMIRAAAEGAAHGAVRAAMEAIEK